MGPLTYPECCSSRTECVTVQNPRRFVFHTYIQCAPVSTQDDTNMVMELWGCAVHAPFTFHLRHTLHCTIYTLNAPLLPLCHLSNYRPTLGCKSRPQDDTNIHMVMELCEGGALLERIESGVYSEAYISKVVRSILRFIAQCHAKVGVGVGVGAWLRMAVVGKSEKGGIWGCQKE